MNLWKKITLILGLFFILIYALVCGLLYLNQESFIFHPRKTDSGFEYQYERKFKEIDLKTSDNVIINSLYFEVENPKGVVYFLHGNAGTLENWGYVADLYLDLGYDVFLIDYRGFGKSEGEIKNEKQFFEDAQLGYDFLKQKFTEDDIIVIGYSIGSGPATYLSSVNHPKLLILQAPLYSIKEEMKVRMPFIPTFILKYNFENNKHIQKVYCPIYIFHGNEDRILSFDTSQKLSDYLKPNDKFITLENQDHHGVNDNPVYMNKMEEILK